MHEYGWCPGSGSPAEVSSGSEADDGGLDAPALLTLGCVQIIPGSADVRDKPCTVCA